MTRTILFLTVFATSVLVTDAAGQADRKLTEGVYTEEQAARGEQLMISICSECHGPEEFDEYFLDSWVGADVAELYELIVSTMPEDSPGSLLPEEYADALAYIFQLGGVPPGNEELKPDVALMRYIIIER